MTRRKHRPGQAHRMGRVIRAQSGLYAVQTDSGTVTATLRGRLKRQRQDLGLVALGDFVRLEPIGDELAESPGTPVPPSAISAWVSGVDAVVVEILPRASMLARRAPGPKGVWARDIIVANIDLLAAVFSAREPEPHLGMLDRFLALAEMDELSSLIVMNKVDLTVPPALAARLETYEAIGYRVLLASAATGQGMDALAAELAGRVSAVVGPSGVGKSSLLNALCPGFELPVGPVSEAVGKGRHTTRVAQLLPLPGGGLVADTPGLREIGMWDVDPGELEWAFVEFRPYLRQCRFYDCTHAHEPDCAIQRAVADGEIAPERYASYLRLLAEEED
jgi:ribosome biogenesis GTPase